MRIDRVELFHVAMPLISPWRTAYGEDSEIHSVLCRMTSGSLDAWGESSPLAAPCYSPEWGGGVFATVRDWLAPAVVGKEIRQGADLQRQLAPYKGNSFAKALLDTAWWSLEAKRQNQPLHRLLGADRDLVCVGADFGVLGSVGELLDQVDAAVKQQFARVKLKFRPGWDTPVVEAVRRRHPTLTLHIDCNAGYRLDDLAMFQRLDALELAMFEQPLRYHDLVEHAELQRQVTTPVCLDESVTCPEVAQQALALGSCRYVNIKPGRVGGLTPAVAIHDFCREAAVPCWVGGMLESAVGAGICAALAMLDNFTYPADLFPSSRFYHEDLGDPPLELTALDDRPAIRAFERLPEPHAGRLARFTRQHAVIKA